MPEAFPEGTRFFDKEGMPVVLLPNRRWCSAVSGSVLVERPEIREEIVSNAGFRPFDDVDEAELRLLASARE